MYSELNCLKHILIECEFIESCKIGDVDLFLRDEQLKRAVVRSLEIIGEASKKIGIDFKLKWNEIEWKHMAGMRDRLIHDYLGIDYDLVIDVIINKIPNLKIQIINVIQQEENI